MGIFKKETEKTNRTSLNKISSCLPDQPLDKLENDKLEAADYAHALCNFIHNAETPVTIGIQGGWGSGKTSLITIMQEKLSEKPTRENNMTPTICVNVNAWEHSLFQGKDNKAEVALSLLNGLILGVKQQASDTEWLEDKIKKEISEASTAVESALRGLKLGLGFLIKAGAQMGANMIGAGDISQVKIG